MSRYRVDRSLGRTLYRDNQLIGIMDTPEDAQLVVNALGMLDDAFGPQNPAPRPAPDVSWITTEPGPSMREKTIAFGLLTAGLATLAAVIGWGLWKVLHGQG